MKKYSGERTIDGISVVVDGKSLPYFYEVHRFAQYGFEWSYEGPEPTQLAFALLYDHSGDAAPARNLAQSFMKQVVANFDNEWEMTGADIDAAISGLGGSRAA
ncbi:MAG: hypothetical protein K2W78_08230 [Xanthobacteraceae bacterium]|nr:hypothetical protein [Xanthobacteraceae bacterium]